MTLKILYIPYHQAYTYKNGTLIIWDYGSQQEPMPAPSGGF